MARRRYDRKERKEEDRAARAAAAAYFAEQLAAIKKWRTPAGATYVSIDVADRPSGDPAQNDTTHVEHWPVDSRQVARYLRYTLLPPDGGRLSGHQVAEIQASIDAEAALGGDEVETHLRVADTGDAFYIDLANSRWEAIEITAKGWRVVSDPPVKFIRAGFMRELPHPEPCEAGLPALLGPFVNTASERDFCLFVSVMLAYLSPRPAYPVALISGEWGSAKSTAARVLRELVDPNRIPLMGMPENAREMINAAVNRHVLAIDNVSRLPGWASDLTCQIASGGGAVARELYSDQGEVGFWGARGVVVTGIGNLTARGDLLSRSVRITLGSMAGKPVKREREFWAEFAAVRPQILGGLCDGLASALRHAGKAGIPPDTRLADFVDLACAAAPGLGWTAQDFLAAYAENREAVMSVSVDDDPVASAIRDLLDDRGGEAWSGTATELLVALRGKATEAALKSRDWPESHIALGGAIDRAAPALRRLGYVIERRHSRDRRRREITITRLGDG